MIKKLLLILLLLSVASPALADKDYLYPVTSFSQADWVGLYTYIDDTQGSPIDGDYVYVATKNKESATNPLTNTIVGASDTINYIIIHLRSQLTGTPGNEYVRATLTYVAETEVFEGGSNASWATDSTGQLTDFGIIPTALSVTLLDALTYTFRAGASGGSAVTQWQVSSFYVEVDYTPGTTTTTLAPTTTTTTLAPTTTTTTLAPTTTTTTLAPTTTTTTLAPRL